MSKSSLQSFEYKIDQEASVAIDVKFDMQHISKSILDVMNDKVGESAIISISRICDVFANTAENIINNSKNATRTLEIGYDKIDALSLQGDRLVANAEGLMRELGDL